MKSKSRLSLKLVTAALIVVAFISAFFVNTIDNRLSWIMLAITAITSLILVVLMLVEQKNIYKFIATIDNEIKTTERESLYNFPAPTIITDENMKIIWYNKAFAENIYDGDDAFGVKLNTILALDNNTIKNGNNYIVKYNGKSYKISTEESQRINTKLIMIYFEDITPLLTLENKFNEARPAVILIIIDNYEEVLQNVKESEKAHVLVQVEKLFEKFMEKSDGLIRKISNDRFIAVIEEKHLSYMINDKFKILDRARAITVNDKMCVTLSVGIGHGGNTLSQSEVFAKQALDMALGRGGDQVAIKNEKGFEFYGGISQGVEKHAKVKTRIIAAALIEMIENSEKVYVMGHRFGDLDSVGSAIGLSGAIHNLGKYVKVVVDPEKNLAKSLIDRFHDVENYDLFLSPRAAVAEITENTLLIIVDTHVKTLVESEELYSKSNHIVVIDHHRKTVNYIDNAVIFHHEPYASSASEMITELIQYFGDINKLSSTYAEALLSGIMLDTKSFVMKTGVRTFEAAAFLKKLGADTIAVRGLFSSSIESYQKKAKLVAGAEIYKNCAISMTDITGEDILIVAPQAADELLNISGVVASFVIYENGGSVCLSARSMGSLNVQVIMEKLGGGGHQTMAGTQLQNTTLETARQKLLEAIDEHINEIS